MPVLSRKNSREEYKLVGVQIPPRVHNFITLYTLANGIPKSKLFNQLINDWIEHQKMDGITNKELLEEIAVNILTVWNKRKATKPRASHTEFVSSLKEELLDKGITKKQLTIIFSKLAEIDGENKERYDAE